MRHVVKTFIMLFMCFTLLMAEKAPAPFGTEPIRNDAPCDAEGAWDDLFFDMPQLHEYTVYQGNVVVDGDTSDSDWMTVPWTAFDVWNNIAEELPLSHRLWEMYDEYWESPADYSGWFKMLYNPQDSLFYVLVKEIDDMMTNAGPEATDVTAADVQEVAYYRGDSWEIDMLPMKDPVPGWVMDHVANFFVVDGEPRYQDISLKEPPEPIQLADGDAVTSWEDTDGKAIFYSRNEETSINVLEFAFKTLDGMQQDNVWLFGIVRNEADEAFEDGNNRVGAHMWGAGKRKPAETWSTLMFGPELPQTGVKDSQTGAVNSHTLHANYPNPFNPSTTIEYTVSGQNHVNISVYNVIGEHIATLVDQHHAAGTYKTVWNATNSTGEPVANGIYFYKMETGIFSQTHSMLLVK